VEERQLRYASAVAQWGTFGRAAKALGITQPRLSRQIAALENEIGVALFERNARGTIMTAAGAAFLDHAAEALDALDAGVHEAQRVGRGEAGQLRIGFISSSLLTLLAPILSAYTRRHPSIRLDVQEMASTRSAELLLQGHLDLAVTRGAPRGPGAENLRSAVLSEDHVIAVLSRHHPLAGQAQLHSDQLRGRTLIATSITDEPDTVRSLGPLLAASPVTETRDISSIVGLASCGLGIGLAPQLIRPTVPPGLWVCDLVPRIPLPSLLMSVDVRAENPALGGLLRLAAISVPAITALLQR
jgi:DNA-binding transcriptional LysR family regulator